MSAASIPFKPEHQDLPSSGTWGVALLLCGLALVVLVLLARKYGHRLGARASRAEHEHHTGARVVETVRLTHNARLAVVEFEGRKLLLAVTPDGVSKLDSAPAQAAQQVEP